jgi:uncharacterized protein (TIGR00269 family)
MFTPNDRIAIAVSGGKDSLSLLYILNKIEKKFPKSELIAITIDEGISNYRSEAVQLADEQCQALKIEHHTYSFKELFGYDLDDIVKTSESRGKLTSCSYCGILRRKALNLAAKNVNASKLATGHNLDDEVQSMVMNLLRGDIDQMRRMGSVLDGKRSGFVERVKPLCHLPEKDVAFYAYLKEIRFQSISCPYMETSMRSDVRRFLDYLEAKHAGIKFNIFQTFEKVEDQLGSGERNNKINQCTICHEPTSGKTCRSCNIILSLGLELQKPKLS